MSEVVSSPEQDLRSQSAQLLHRAEAAFRSLLESYPSDSKFDGAQIDFLLDASSWFYRGDQRVIDFMLEESQQAGNLLINIPGVVGCFGVGYPFYAIGSDNTPVNVQTIGTFITSLRDLIKPDHQSEWTCSSCDVLKNCSLKAGCATCTKAALKPRSLLSSLPDLDIIVVVDRHHTLHEELIEKTLHAQGFFQSDLNINSALLRTQSLIQDLKEGRRPTEHLPIDVHLWSFEDFDKATKCVVEGKPNTIFTRSMYRGWQNDQINHGFDWVFSLSELGDVKPSLRTHLDEHRREFANKVSLGTIDLVEFLTKASRRANELIGIQAIKDILQRRIDSWL